MSEWLDAGELVERVQEFMDIGLYDDARELLTDYEQAYPSNWEIPFLRARICIEQGMAQESIPWFEKSLTLEENNPDSLLGLFYAYSQLNRLAAGAPYLLQAAEKEPDGEPVLSALIWYYTEISDLPKALSCFEHARTLPPEHAETWRNAAVVFQRMGEHERAGACLEQALELAPDGDEERDMLADHYISSGRAAEAVGLYQEYLKRSPRNIKALSRLAFSLVQDDRPTEAAQTARATIEYYPNATTGYVDLAYVFLSTNEPTKALEATGKALSIAPLDSETLRVRAIALSEMEQDGEAEEAFERALQIDPHNPEIQRDYYHHLRAMGKTAEMEKIAHTVIEAEQPYCVEDCWFLADYYREKGETLKAFRYLRRALRYVPGERELFPPLIDIMLERSHLLYSATFLLHYVKRSGWNDTMNAFARHKRLKGKMAQESLRFLRYCSEKGSAYNSYIFILYFQKAFRIGALILIPPLLWLLATLFSWWGILVTVALYAAGYLAMHLVVRRIVHHDNALLELPSTPAGEHPPPPAAG